MLLHNNVIELGFTVTASWTTYSELYRISAWCRINVALIVAKVTDVAVAKIPQTGIVITTGEIREVHQQRLGARGRAGPEVGYDRIVDRDQIRKCDCIMSSASIDLQRDAVYTGPTICVTGIITVGAAVTVAEGPEAAIVPTC